MKLIVVLAMALVPLLVSRAASAKAAPAVPSTFETRLVGVVRASYPPSARVRVGELLAELPRMQTALSKALSHPLGEPIDLRFVWLPEEMAALAPADSPPPRYATGVAYPAQRVAIVALADPRSGRDASARETLAHELAHVALAEATGDAPIPRWFHEGFAIQAAGERSLARYEVLAEAAAFRRLVPLDALDEHFSDESFDVTLAYAEAADVLRFLAHGGDHVRFVSLMERLRVGVDFERGLADAYGSDLRKLDYEWRTDAAKRFAFLPILTGGSVLWLGVALVFGVGWVRKRREGNATLQRWENEELRSKELAETSRRGVDAIGSDEAHAREFELPIDAASSARSRSVVEHDGRWHTLH